MTRLLTFLFILSLTEAFAQQPLEVKVEPRPSSHGVRPAFEVAVPQATADDAVKLWEKTLTGGGILKKSPKMENVKDEWIIRDIVIGDISPEPLNSFTQVSSFPGHIYVRIFLQKENEFLGSEGSSPQITDAASRFISNYAVELYKQAVEKELKEEEKKLTSLENDYDKMTRQNKSFNKKIDKAEKEESSLRSDLKDEKKLLKDTKKSDSPGDLNEEELEKSIKDVNKDIKKAEKAQSKFEKKIDKNEEEQEELEEEIEIQRVKVNEVKEKLKNIR
jgi:hypothetical protein